MASDPTDPALIARVEKLFLKTSAGREISRNWIDLADLRALLARVRELEAERDAARRCLGFFASVIKSGETWTATCEAEYRAALASAPAEGG